MLHSPEFREVRFHDGYTCPHCSSREVSRYGFDRSGKQRYCCKCCKRTFNDLTGTPMARTWYPQLWETFSQTMQLQLSCRKTASTLGINTKTAFAWRHKLLQPVQKIPSPHVSGIVEMDETYFARSCKGQRNLDRLPRKRGKEIRIPGLSKEQVPVMVARDRTGHTATGIIDPMDHATLTVQFGSLVAKNSELCSDSATYLRAFARNLGLRHHILNRSQGERKRGIYHLQNVNAYHSRLKSWMRVFHGVATRYLPNYLAWHLFAEEAARLKPQAAVQILVQKAVALPTPARCPHCGCVLAGDEAA